VQATADLGPLQRLQIARARIGALHAGKAETRVQGFSLIQAHGHELVMCRFLRP
jgi:hypothetical protein